MQKCYNLCNWGSNYRCQSSTFCVRIVLLWFCVCWCLLCIPGTGRPGRLIGSFGYILSDFGFKTGRKRSGRPSGFIWTKFQAKRSILDPIRVIFSALDPTDIVDSTWTSRTRPGMAPWRGLDPSQRLRRTRVQVMIWVKVFALESMSLGNHTGRPGRLIGSFGHILSDFWPQKWSGWVRTTLRIHLDQVSGQTVDSGPDSDYFR